MFIRNRTEHIANEEVIVEGEITRFSLWAPTADAVRLSLYNEGMGSGPVAAFEMCNCGNGMWRVSVPRSLNGVYYTFRVRHNGQWLKETPGVRAKAVGINGQRAAVIDFSATNPPGWGADSGPRLTAPTDAVIYELHYRDFSMHKASGILNKGKFLSLTESATFSPGGDKTGISHLKELGITHVQLMPSFDFSSVDEAVPAYNWGYDPRNYNVPSGAYSTDPCDPYSRVREFKYMIKALHDAGIGVVMDVVYNHTAMGDESNFSLTAPGYYYRMRPDGTYSNASGCGNETASERAYVRDYIIDSLIYWVEQYHIDGFRFDLMGVHDIDTMNAIASHLRQLRPDILLYGEGWTAGESTLPPTKRALKENVALMPYLAVFSDDLRDAVKGHFACDSDCGYVNGRPGLSEAVKIGIVAATAHPQVDYSAGIKIQAPYALTPAQVVNYVSCHDNLTLPDKLRLSVPQASEQQLQRMAKLAHTIVITSQGIPFIFAGEEIFRDKKGDHNSYCSPDSVNAIDWTLKSHNAGLFRYICELIKLRRQHPAFRMTSAADVERHLVFDDCENLSGVISYSLCDNANGDSWKEIKIVFNANSCPVSIRVPKADWIVIAADGELCAEGICLSRGGEMTVAPVSALILARGK